MRFTIDVETLPHGWSVRVLDLDGQPMRVPGSQDLILPEPRVLVEVATDTSAYPLPPIGSPDALPDGITADGLDMEFRNVMNQAAAQDGVQRFGVYLFNTLLGSELWTKIVAAATRRDEIELALTWPADSKMNVLPWDVMHTTGPDAAFLAASGVQMTRRVAGTGDDARRITHLPSPPKVLVVVASELGDPNIRAGAEYLGLLRALKHVNKVLNTRLLIGATASDVSRAIQSFKPNVVHVIGHGKMSDDRPVIAFRGEPDKTMDDPVDAERLLGLLATEANLTLPGLVVLNACAPTSAEEVSIGRPMAAELVARGIPVVVGMSGNVADQACRLFTRGFYTSLLSGDEIAQAAAKGRRAGILFGNYDARSQIDWALPTLYMAEAIGPVSIDLTVTDPDQARLEAAQMFTRKPDYPVFCGRWSFFAAYRNLVSNGGKQFLVIPVDRRDATDSDQQSQPQYGSERLLQELAGEALRDGHIPILVSKVQLGISNHKWPSRPGVFVELIAKAFANTVTFLGHMPEHAALQGRLPEFWALTRQLLADPPVSGLPGEFAAFGLSDDQKLAKALMLDLLEIRRVVCEQRGLVSAEADVKVVLFLEDAHDLLFWDTFVELFGSQGLVDERARTSTRAVLTYHTIPVEPQATTINAINDFLQSSDVDRLPLGPLHGRFLKQDSTDDAPVYQEASLVYRQFLLGWRPEHVPTPLSIAARDSLDRLIVFNLAQSTGWGVPAKLDQEVVTNAINMLRDLTPQMRTANDDDALDAEAKRAAGRTGGEP